MHANKVSVIIPTYNRADFIPLAVDSIIEQKYNNLEIIVVDDGSTDNTAEVIKKYQEKYPFIKFINNAGKKGPAGARNTGMNAAGGDLLAFLDSDNVWLPGQLKEAIGIFKQYPQVDVLFGNFYFVDFKTKEITVDFFRDKCKLLFTLKTEELEKGVKLIKTPLFPILLQNSFFSFPATIIKKSVATVLKLNEDVHYYEDRDFGIQLVKEADAQFAYRDKPIFLNYVHDSNMSSHNVLKLKIKKIEDRLHLYRMYKEKYVLGSSETNIINELLGRICLSYAESCANDRQFLRSLIQALHSLRYDVSSQIVIQVIKTTIQAVTFASKNVGYFLKISRNKLIDIFNFIKRIDTVIAENIHRRLPSRFTEEDFKKAAVLLKRYGVGRLARTYSGKVRTYGDTQMMFKQPIVIIKADDLKSTNFEEFVRLIEVMSERRLPISIGLITKEIKYLNSWQERFLSTLDKNLIEIWHHGYDHSIGKGWREFRSTSFSRQKRHLQAGIQLAQRKLGLKLTTFGAPFNGVDENTARALAQIEEIKIVFYAPKTDGKLTLSRSEEIEAKPEVMMSYDSFCRNFDTNRQELEPIVLQIHPAAWREIDWQNYERIIELLDQKLNYNFMTPIGYLRWKEESNKAKLRGTDSDKV